MGWLFGVMLVEMVLEFEVVLMWLCLIGVVVFKNVCVVEVGEGVVLIEVDGVVCMVCIGVFVDGDLWLLCVDVCSVSFGCFG